MSLRSWIALIPASIMVSSPEVARVPKAELDRGRGRLCHFPSCSKENMPYGNHLFQCHGEARMMSLVASPRRQRPLQEPRGWIWYWGLVDRVTYVTDKAYAIRSTISPSTTQRRRGQRLRARPESPRAIELVECRVWLGTMHASCGRHTQARSLIFMSGVTPAIHPWKGQLFQKAHRGCRQMMLWALLQFKCPLCAKGMGSWT